MHYSSLTHIVGTVGTICVVSLLSCFSRVELHKRNVLEQCDLEQEGIYRELRQKKVAQDHTLESIKAQLLVSFSPAFNASLP